MVNARIQAGLVRAQTWGRRNRRVVLPVSIVLFTGALAWAITELDLNPSELQLGPFLVNLFLLTPAALLLNGAGISITAWALGKRVGLGAATAAAGIGTIAEFAPAPGGLMARATTLLAAGVPGGTTAWALGGGAALRVGLALSAAAFSLWWLGIQIWLVLGAVGVLLVMAGAVVLYPKCGTAGTAALMGQRLASIILASLRLWCAFSALGATISLFYTPVFAAAAILGTVASIAPGGLGIGELLGAGVAPLLSIAPAAAFAALAQNRLLGFLWSGMVAAIALRNATREPVN